MRYDGSCSSSDDDLFSQSSVGSSRYLTVLNLTSYLSYSLFYFSLFGLYWASMGSGFLENLRNITHLAIDQCLNMITAFVLFAIGFCFLFFPILDKVKPKSENLYKAEFGYVFALSMTKTVEVRTDKVRTIFGVNYTNEFEDLRW